MTPVFCKVRHDPENGTYGDCVRACVASLLDFPSPGVPHFFHDNPQGNIGRDRMIEWLSHRGLVPFFIYYDGEASLQEVLDMSAEHNATARYMLFGRTAQGDHVVVCHGSEVEHDPSWMAARLIGGASNGFWTVMVLVKA